jgi:heat shock protein HslJ
MVIIKKTFILFVLILLLALSCRKGKTDTLDITKYKWKLKSVTINSETFTPHENKNRYVLVFVNDSTFNLNLSINSGWGGYKLPTKGDLIILGYSAITEICCENDFDEKLITSINGITKYNVSGRTLILQKAGIKVEFKRKL